MTNPTYPGIAHEFPDYDQTTLPAIPAGWTDASWHNDTCPKFETSNTDVIVFIDYADPEERECKPIPRFSVQEWTDLDCDELLASDDWAEVLRLLAAKGLGA